MRAHLTLTSPELNRARMTWTQLDSLYIPAAALPAARDPVTRDPVALDFDWLAFGSSLSFGGKRPVHA